MNDPDPDNGSVAIVGMAGRFPGARDLVEFWQNLRDGVEAVRPLTDSQLSAAGVTPEELNDPSYVKAAAILDSIDQFDAAFFGFSPKDAAIMDPQHRFFLECAWHALENAGWSADQFRGRIGVYAGSGMNNYLIYNLLGSRDLARDAGLFVLKHIGNSKDVLATRVSYQLNLTGPSLAVQTACSTSLVAIHLASQALLNHECDMALAGGVTIEVPHGRGYLYREGEILSRDGHCRPFDAGSTGTIFGSGVGIVVLRRLQDALRDGDYIHAIIRGTAINNDGSRKVGFLAPSVAGQAEVIAEALAVAGVAADSISYVEAHGTGTAIGDPIEVEALTRAFRESTDRKNFCALGSLKANVGHLDAAAGVAGVIKAVLALSHRQIPPSLNFEKPNPLIDFAASPFFVNVVLREWRPAGKKRRAGVTSLGIGGTNAHVVLEEAPERPIVSAPRRPELLTLSAKTPSALDTMARNLANSLDDQALNLADVAFTCHLGRTAFLFRRALVCTDSTEATTLLRDNNGPNVITQTAQESEPSVVFMFPGQGAQYVGMARALFESNLEFRSTVETCCDALARHLDHDLRRIIFPAAEDAEAASRLLSETRFTQPALFVIEYALARLWMSLGIRPAAMIGHSVGEFAAACIAEVFSLEDTLRIVAERGRLIQSMPRGAMIAVAAAENEVLPLIGAKCSLAAVNAPSQCVVAGPEAAIAELEGAIAARKLPYRRLHVSHAFHSAMMDPILGPFEEFVGSMRRHAPKIPWVSSATGGWVTAAEASSPAYWTRQLRETVRFHQGASVLIATDEKIFLEVGPGHTLGALLAQHPHRSSSTEVIPSLGGANQGSEDGTFLRALGTLWALGSKVDWSRLHRDEKRQRVPLPVYPFERQRYWVEADKQPAQTIPAAPTATIEASDVADLFQPIWHAAELPGSDSSSRDDSPWLIFADAEGLGAMTAEIIRRQGGRVIIVRPGDSFARIDQDEFRLAPRNRNDYDELIAALNASGLIPRRILHCWCVIDIAAPRDALDELSDLEAASFWSLLFLAQALGADANSATRRIAVVSNSLHSVTGETVARPARALLVGPCQVLPKELPNLHCISIDIALPTRTSSSNGAGEQMLREVARQIVTEINSGAGDVPVAYRRSRRFVRRYEKLTRRNSQPLVLRDGAVHLITGGLGGIGLTLAETIARASRARLVLVSRTGLPPREEWPRLILGKTALADQLRKLEAIEKAGTEFLVLAADVTDERAMREVLQTVHERFGAITGVIHAAGVIDDAPILTKTEASAAAVLSTKVRGTLVIEHAFASERLEYLILVSSVSSILAPAGQVDYAAANAFLDSFAQANARNGTCQVIAIQYPRWRDVGMAADSARAAGLPWYRAFKGERREKPEPLITVSTTLSVERDWIVGEHKTREGVGVFPGVGYIELILGAAGRILPAGPISIRDLQFKLPLEVGAEAERRVELNLTRDGDHYLFSAVVETADGLVECASAQVTAGDDHAPARRDLEALRRGCNREMTFTHKQNAKQERTFAFGPRWRTLERINLGRTEAVTALELPPEYTDDLNDYRVHPALLDMATGSAMFLIEGYEALDCTYIPVSYGRVTIYRSLPARCYSHIVVRSGASAESRNAVFDINILDQDGNVLMEIEEFTLRQFRDPAILEFRRILPGDAEPSPNGVSQKAINRRPDSIISSEGSSAFLKILGGARAPNVVMFPSDFDAFVAQLRPMPPGGEKNHDQPSGASATRDDVAATLAQWWKELLGADPVTPQSDFFRLGGQSLTAVRLFAKIKRSYGVELSAATIYEAPTVEKLAQRIREAKEPHNTGTSRLIPIRSTGSKPPLFLFPDMNGTTIGFDSLVRVLALDRPIYGVESQTFTSDRPAALSLEEMAVQFVASIRSVWPHGPYNLLGYSFGGLLGFEAAQQLVASGETIGWLGMLDTWQLGHIRELDAIHSRRQKVARRARKAIVHARRLVFGPDRFGYFEDYIVGRIRRQVVASVFRRLLARYQRDRRPLPKVLRRANEINWFAAQDYVARPYPGRIAMFRAINGIASDDPRYGEALGWQNLAAGGVEVHEVPGTHRALLQEPNVRILAREIDACLAAAESQLNKNVTEVASVNLSF